MGNLNIALLYHCILQGRIYLSMSQELLELLNGHSFIYCHGCKCTPELVRVYLVNS